MPRNPASPEVKAPKADKRSSSKGDKVKKTLMLDDADLVHIDKIALPYGFTRQAAIVLILLDWFGLKATTPPVPKSQG